MSTVLERAAIEVIKKWEAENVSSPNVGCDNRIARRCAARDAIKELIEMARGYEAVRISNRWEAACMVEAEVALVVMLYRDEVAALKSSLAQGTPKQRSVWGAIKDALVPAHFYGCDSVLASPCETAAAVQGKN